MEETSQDAVNSASMLNNLASTEEAGATSYELHSGTFPPTNPMANETEDVSSPTRLVASSYKERETRKLVTGKGNKPKKRRDHTTDEGSEPKRRKCRCHLLSCILCTQQGVTNPEFEMQVPESSRQQIHQQQLPDTIGVSTQHYQLPYSPTPGMFVQALPYTPPLPGVPIPAAAYSYSHQHPGLQRPAPVYIPGVQQIPRVGYPMGVQIPAHSYSSFPPTPGVCPPVVHQVPVHGYVSSSSLPGFQIPSPRHTYPTGMPPTSPGSQIPGPNPTYPLGVPPTSPGSQIPGPNPTYPLGVPPTSPGSQIPGQYLPPGRAQSPGHGYTPLPTSTGPHGQYPSSSVAAASLSSSVQMSDQTQTSNPLSSTQAVVSINTAETRPSEQQQLSTPPTGTHDIIHGAAPHLQTGPDPSGVNDEAPTNQQNQCRDNSPAAMASNGEGEAPRIEDLSRAQQVPESHTTTSRSETDSGQVTVPREDVPDTTSPPDIAVMTHATTQGTAKKKKRKKNKRPKNITLTESDQAESKIPLQLSPHRRNYGKPQPTELLLLSSDTNRKNLSSTKNKLARTISHSPETTTPIRPRQHGRIKRPLTYTEGIRDIQSPPQRSYEAVTSTELLLPSPNEGSYSQLEQVSESSEAKNSLPHQQVQERGYNTTPDEEEEKSVLLQHATPKVGDTELHGPTWIGEDSSEEDMREDHDELPTNKPTTRRKTGAESQNQRKKMTTASDPGTTKGSEVPLEQKTHSPKTALHTGITRIDDVALEINPVQTDSAFPTSTVVVVEMHSQKDATPVDSNHEVTWVDDDGISTHRSDPGQTIAGEAKKGDLIQRSRYLPVTVVSYGQKKRKCPCHLLSCILCTPQDSVDSGAWHPEAIVVATTTNKAVEQPPPSPPPPPPPPSGTVPPTKVTLLAPPQSSVQHQMPSVFEGRIVNNPIFSPQELDVSAPPSEVIVETVQPLQATGTAAQQYPVDVKNIEPPESMHPQPPTDGAEKADSDLRDSPPMLPAYSEIDEGSKSENSKSRCFLLSCFTCTQRSHSGLEFDSHTDSMGILPETAIEISKEEESISSPPAALTVLPLPQSSTQQHIPAAFAGRSVDNPLFNRQTQNYPPLPAANVANPVFTSYYPSPPAASVANPVFTSYYPPTPQQIQTEVPVQLPQTAAAPVAPIAGTTRVVGYTPPKLTHRQKEARETIISRMKTEVEQASSSQQGEKYKAACCRRCTDITCQSWSCTPSCNLFGRSNTSKPVAKQLLTSDTLHKGRADGSKDFLAAILPLFPWDWLRILLVIIEVILVFVGLILSITSLSLDENRGFNIAHLVLAIVAAILATIDAWYTLKDMCCKKCKQEGEDGHKNQKDNTESCYKKCCSQWTNFFDTSRVVLSEVIFYPLLICDMFELIVGRGLEGNSAGDIVGIFLFVISLCSMIITVYIARIVLLVALVINATNVRTPDQKLVRGDQKLPGEHDPEIRRSAIWYQGCFCAHVVLQMFAQLLMYITIAAKIRYDNRHFYESGNNDESIYVSSYLGYMIFAGYVSPILGLFSFFIVTYYWSEQYPIGYRIDMMRIFKMTEIGMVDITKFGAKLKERAEDFQESVKQADHKFLHIFSPLRNDFEEIFRKGWMYKFAYPFKSPMLVIICLVYAILQLTFVICAAQAVDEMGVVVTHVLNGGNWIAYYIFAIIVGLIANLYVFVVAGLWIAIITAILVLIAMVIAFIAFVLALLCLFVMCSNSNRNRNTY